MSRTKEQIIEDIKSKIGANGKQSITGNKLQRLLVDTVTDLSTTNEENIKLETKQDVLVNEVNIKSLGGVSVLGRGDIPVDSTVTKNSSNVVTSGAVYEAIKNISPTPTPSEIPVLYICDKSEPATDEEAAHNLTILDQLAEQISDYKGQINIPVKLVFRWNDNEEQVEYKVDGDILALEKLQEGSSDTYYLKIEYKSYDELMELERTTILVTDNDEENGLNGQLFYNYPSLFYDFGVMNHPINIPITILQYAEDSEGEEIELNIPWPVIRKDFHIISYDIVNESLKDGFIIQYTIGGGILSYNIGGGTSKSADGDLYDDVDYYQVFFDYNDKIIRLRVYGNDHVTTMWKSKGSQQNTNVVVYELWNEKNISNEATPSEQAESDLYEGTILEGNPERLYQENWFNVRDYNTNNNMLTEAITNFLNGKTVILYDSTSEGLYMKVIAAASLEEPVRIVNGDSTSLKRWPHNQTVGLVCINPYNMKKAVWTYIRPAAE